MPKYLVISPLKTGDVTHQEGDTVEMDAKSAKELLALGVLRAAPAQAQKAEKAEKTEKAE